MQSFLVLELARHQQAERLAVADQPQLTPVDGARPGKVWPWSAGQSAGADLSAAATLFLQAVFADRWAPRR